MNPHLRGSAPSFSSQCSYLQLLSVLKHFIFFSSSRMMTFEILGISNIDCIYSFDFNTIKRSIHMSIQSQSKLVYLTLKTNIMRCAVFIHIILVIYLFIRNRFWCCKCIYVCAQYACLVARNMEDASSPLRLELDRFESPCGNLSQVLWKNRQCP